MSDQEKASANENPCKRIIEELSALDDAMNKHQCYNCNYEFINVVENFGTNILADAIAYLKAIDRGAAPSVDVVPVKHVIIALMDLRDAFVAKQPRGEWYKSDRAQGIEQGIEMAIEKVREIAERREDV